MAQVVIKESKDLDKLLEGVELSLRSGILATAVGAGAKVVEKEARARAPRGNPAHNSDAKPLWKTIGTIKRVYGGVRFLAIVGPIRPAGAHGHLVEDGHEVKVSRGSRKGEAPLTGSAKVPGKKFMAAAVDATLAQQDRMIVATLVEGIKKAGG